MIYFDNAATTPVAKQVLKEALPYFDYDFGNPSSVHPLGVEASIAIESARQRVAEFFGCSAMQVVFTSGGSEGNTTVFYGLRKRLIDSGKTHILVSSTEHESVLRAAESLAEFGFDVERIPVDSSGVVPIGVLEGLLRKNTGLVSVMYVNNETGAVNPVEEIGAICKKRGVLFHTDCVQAAGAVPLDVEKIGCDFATISGHKIHGMKGTGALYMKDRILTSVIYGGETQEYGIRGGTENVPGIVALGAACHYTSENYEEDIRKITEVKQIFYAELLSSLERRGVSLRVLHVNGALPVTKGKILNLRFDGVDAQTLALAIGLGEKENQVCASAGSACTSHSTSPSHVLLAMGLSDWEARSSLRFSFSRQNTIDEACVAAEIVADCVSLIFTTHKVGDT